ncbi:MAG: type II toxin-antitoxin system HipA family toxin [Rhodoglobus sp.]
MNLPKAINVYLDDDVRVGTLRPSYPGRALASSSFEYDPSYIESGGYSISPDLPLERGRQYAPESSTLFGVFSDAAPDEWGQRIIYAARTRAAKKAGERLSTVSEFDYLLGVSDASRMGALRLRDPASTTWLSSDDRVANLHELPRILAAARRYEAHEATDEDIAYLNGVATSPGGARPKANVILEDGRLALAKLPHSKDGNVDTERWEAVVLSLASQAGIRVPRHFLAAGEGRKAVLVLDRFDRDPPGTRIGYMSAATAMGITAHNAKHELTYLDFADTVAEVSAHPRRDLRELFARLALTIFVNNVDDHWRNHGFLRRKDGWELSPVFDVNPTTSRGVINSRLISASSIPGERHISDLMESASAYQLNAREASEVAATVASAVAGWREEAARLGVLSGEIDTMVDAFDPELRDHVLSAQRPV